MGKKNETDWIPIKEWLKENPDKTKVWVYFNHTESISFDTWEYDKVFGKYGSWIEEISHVMPIKKPIPPVI